MLHYPVKEQAKEKGRHGASLPDTHCRFEVLVVACRLPQCIHIKPANDFNYVLVYAIFEQHLQHVRSWNHVKRFFQIDKANAEQLLVLLRPGYGIINQEG